tara:strand:- start:6629 stop:7657 length:1029 start_codon:yes stop_codon:yes gene_type:complete
VNQINTDQILKSVKLDSIKELKETSNELDANKLLNNKKVQYISNELFSSIVRFMQNNKSYKFIFKKEKKLNEKEYKKLKRVVNNISMEGAYFLNPEFLDKVKIKLYHNKKDSIKILKNYLEFIVEKELINNGNKKIDIPYSKNLIDLNFVLNEDLREVEIFYNNIKLVNHFIKSYNELNPKKKINHNILNISNEDINFLDSIFYGLKIKKSYIKPESIEKFKNHLQKFDNQISNENFTNSWMYLFVNQNQNYKELIYSSDFYEKLKNSYNFKIFQKNFEENGETFNNKNFNFEILKKSIIKNIIFIDTKLNFKEFISIIIFSIIFAFVIFAIINGFSKKNNS